jgi:hypothetical protein
MPVDTLRLMATIDAGCRHRVGGGAHAVELEGCHPHARTLHSIRDYALYNIL